MRLGSTSVSFTSAYTEGLKNLLLRDTGNDPILKVMKKTVCEMFWKPNFIWEYELLSKSRKCKENEKTILPP